MYLQRRSSNLYGYSGLIIPVSAAAVIFICMATVLFFAYRNNKKKESRALRRAENNRYELSVVNQTERRQDRLENNGLSNEFCDPLPLYTPPENSIKIQNPQLVEDPRVRSPPYSVSQ